MGDALLGIAALVLAALMSLAIRSLRVHQGRNFDDLTGLAIGIILTGGLFVAIALCACRFFGLWPYAAI